MPSATLWASSALSGSSPAAEWDEFTKRSSSRWDGESRSKTIRGDRLSPQKRERFLREQTVLAALHQTHIVPIHTAGQAGDLQYFAMPYIEGVTLQQIIGSVRRQQSLSPDSRTPTLARLAHLFDSTILVGDNASQTNPSPDPKCDSPSPPEKLHLSIEYFRSVATVMSDAADACHHVHGLQILHRDLKPSNLMVDTAGQCWIIDFGLAHFLNDTEPSASGTVATRSVNIPARFRHHLTLEDGARPGTPPYMAPEQWKQQAIDTRTDVWGLGVTLYEMLTLRPRLPGSLHEIERKVQSDDPPLPRELVKGMPPDLEAVCSKALKKEPARRYQTAQEFAADLRRWLNHEPVTARRTRVPRRVWLWARRNRGWAAAIAVFCLACAGRPPRKSDPSAIGPRLPRPGAPQRREKLLQQMQNLRLLPHQTTVGANWLDDGWDLVRQAAQIRKDDALRDQAAAFFAGVNGHLVKVMPGLRASAVAFDADGRRLLIGGSAKDETRIWDSVTDDVQKSGIAAAGPVTFRSDGAAWQLAASKTDRFPLQLWGVAKRRLVREFTLPEQPGDGKVGELRVSGLVLTPDGKFAAAAATLKSQTVLLAVWDTSNGNIVRQIRQTGSEVTAIAVSDDGAFLAAGNAEGQIAVWPLPDGDPSSLRSARPMQVNCLAFGVNVPGRASRDMADKWLLASGDHGGTVIAWDSGAEFRWPTAEVPITTSTPWPSAPTE